MNSVRRQTVDERKSERIADNLAYLIRIFFIMRDRMGESGAKPHPLDPQYYALKFLEHGDLTMSDLCRRLQRSKPNMTGIVDKMIRDGLVRRMEDPKDRRVVRIAITSTGRRLLDERMKAVKRCIKENLSVLDDGELDELCDSLERMNRIVNKLAKIHRD